MDKPNLIDSEAVQVSVAKVTGLTATSTFVFGWTINEFVAIGGLLIAAAGFLFQVWLGRQRLKIQRIAAGVDKVGRKVDKVQAEVKEIHDCIDK